MTNPFAEAYDCYWNAGWRGVLPLPFKEKKHPPKGYTGATGTDPSYPDIMTWADGSEGDKNICIRLPGNIVGIDVDAYGDKQGKDTLILKQLEWGELPRTWRTTSRDDGVSGIRFFRIPEGLAWPSQVGPGIDIVHRSHRYALVWPSVHPLGQVYRWIDPEGNVVVGHVPDPDELPLLPHEWVVNLTGGEMAVEVRRNDLAYGQAMLYITELPHATGEYVCKRMQKALDKSITDLADGAHDGATSGALRLIRLASEGHHGAVNSIVRLRDAFKANVTNRQRAILKKAIRTQDEADKEWADIVTSAVNVVSADDKIEDLCDCDGSITDAIVAGAAPASGASGGQQDQRNEPEMMVDGAGFILDAPDQPPALWGFGQEVLWAEGESLMIVGPPGVGKTTIMGQLLRCRLGLDESFLKWGVSPSKKSVLYLAMDRPAQIARSLRRQFTEGDRGALEAKLKVWTGPPPEDVAKNSEMLYALAQLADADTIIVDSVKDAAVGLTDDETAAGYNRARQRVLANGIQLVELHHLVKRGPNGVTPKQLADVYGSAWLTAGAGSVFLLSGNAGDPVVEMHHLKQPMEDCGPLILVHDHANGTTSIDDSVSDLGALLVSNQRNGLSPKNAAMVIFSTESPTKSEVEKARRKLETMVENGQAVREDNGRGRGHSTLYFPAENKSRTSHADDFDSDVTERHASHAESQNSRSESHDKVTEVTDTESHARARPVGTVAREQWPPENVRICQRDKRALDADGNCPACLKRGDQ